MDSILKISTYLASLYKEKEKEKVKILHYNARDSLLKTDLEDEGYGNYLAVSADQKNSKTNPDLYYEKDKNLIYKNNADVLILEEAGFDEMNRALFSFAETIILKPKNLFISFSYFAVWAYHYARKRKWDFQAKNLIDSYGRKSRFIVFKRKYEIENEARYYLSPNMGVDEFFQKLNRKDIRYVILRWFEKIPFTDINEDIDLLIADEDVRKVQSLLNEKVGILPFDLYSVSGMPGSSFRYIAYYPPYLAAEILNNREVWKGKYFVPDPRHHFLSLLYHVIYHKGEKSGIPSHEGARADTSQADHEYLGILQDLAEKTNIRLEGLTLDYFHQFLEKEGWSPATDTIRKLNTRNDSWLSSIIRHNEMNFEKNGELMVFVIRDWAAENGLSDFIVDWFDKAGLNPVKKIELTAEQKIKATQNLRGGNWGNGPWPVSGGSPAEILVVYDYHPKPLEAEKRKKYPHVSNANYMLKEELRKEINAKLPAEKRTNPIHSSDDEIEALDYLAATAPECIEEVKTIITEWDKAYQTNEKVLGDLSQHKRRAKVEIIEYEGKKAIKKTYKAGKERFLKREIYAYGELSKECSYIPPLIASGENYLIIPFLEKITFSENEFVKKQMLKKYKKDVFNINEFFYSKGYALIDFHPGNILITNAGLKLIDYEFLYQYPSMPKSINDSFDLKGFPEDLEADLPVGVSVEDRRELWKQILY